MYRKIVPKIPEQSKVKSFHKKGSCNRKNKTTTFHLPLKKIIPIERNKQNISFP